MKKSTILKFGIIFVLYTSLVACAQTSALGNRQQTIEVPNLEFSVERQIFHEKNEIIYSTPYAKIHGMSDKDIETTVNETLKTASVQWANQNNFWSNKLTVHVSYVDSNYLSVLYHYAQREGISDDLRIHVIVDLHTGKRLFLEDIVELTESLSAAILAQNYKFKDSEFYGGLAEEGIARVLHQASISELERQKELIHEDPLYAYIGMGHEIAIKASVGLSIDGLIITRSIHPLEDIVIPWDQVPDLKIQLNPDMACSSSLDMYKEGNQKPWQSKLYFPWYP